MKVEVIEVQDLPDRRTVRCRLLGSVYCFIMHVHPDRPELSLFDVVDVVWRNGCFHLHQAEPPAEAVSAAIEARPYLGEAIAKAKEGLKDSVERAIAERWHTRPAEMPAGTDCQDRPRRSDVCRYAEPQLITYKPEGEDDALPFTLTVCPTRTPKYEGSNASGMPVRRSWEQVDAEKVRINEEVRASLRSQIARLMQWPFCGHTQRGVSVVWIDDVAYWKCEECA